MKEKIAFFIYLANTLGWIGFGMVYLSCSTIMPYHRQAIGMNFEELTTGVQVLLQALIKMTAAGFFVAGVACMILLLVPFRKGERWAHRSIPLIGIIWNGISLWVTATVAIKAHAATPWPAAAAGIVFLAIAYCLSPGTTKTDR
ncbi:MAG: hypothetical protein SWH61_16975 [Thermodesulfobacteriota bacterium]|nr:hypothetical protein [Thermodesulfobacteriota bacterium]